MKLEYKGQFLYIRSGPEYANELYAEEFAGIWRNMDETKRIEITYIAQITEVCLFPDLWEVHIYVRGRKTPKQYKFPDEATFDRFVAVVQSGLCFDLS